MAKRDPGDIFSYSEFAIAGDMTKRAFQHLADANSKAPLADWLPPGGGVRAIKRVAVIGGFVSAGVPLFPAARITSAILVDFNTSDGEVPSGLGFIARLLPRTARVGLPSDDTDGDYWYHRALIEHPDVYAPGFAQDGDARIEVIDRTHIFMTGQIGILNIWDGEKDKASYLGRVTGWERDREVVFESAASMASIHSDEPDFKSKGSELNRKSRAAYRNAVGRITVNVSLAVRNGLDRVARHRGHLPGQVEA